MASKQPFTPLMTVRTTQGRSKNTDDGQEDGLREEDSQPEEDLHEPWVGESIGAAATGKD